MKKKLRKPATALSVILSVIMLLSVCPVMSFAAYPVEYYYPSGTTFVSEIAFAHSPYYGGALNINATNEKLTDKGYTVFGWDLNEGCGSGSDWIAGGYKKSDDVTKALRDVRFFISDSGNPSNTYTRTVNGRSVTYYLVGGAYESNTVKDGGIVDLNDGAKGKYIYTYITRDPAYGAPITEIKINGSKSEAGYTESMSLTNASVVANLNEGTKGDGVYVHMKNNSTSVDTKKLREVFALAEKMVPNKTNYTSASYTPLIAAYNNAKPIVESFDKYGATSISQAQINEVYNALNSAVYSAQTTVYFNASNNGGTTSVSSMNITIGPETSYVLDVSECIASKGTWSFLGWNTDKNAQSGATRTVSVGFNNTLYAIFGRDVNTTFKYLLSDGSVKTESAGATIYNTAFTAEIDAPTVSDIVFGGKTLTFLGWRTDAQPKAAEYSSPVTLKDGITYTFRAVYSTPVTLSFDNNGGDTSAPESITRTKYYSADASIVEGSVNFTVPDDILTRKDYAFVGWSTDKDAETAEYNAGDTLSGIKNDTVLYAVWTQEFSTVTFKNYDGTVLQESDVPHGQMPEFIGLTPVKVGTADTKWVFDGWDKELSVVSGEQEYTAVFHSETADYAVLFLNYDGSVLQSSNVKYQEMPSYTGNTPVREPDAQYSYAFAGWDKEFTLVEGEQTYTATYTPTVNSYSVKFVNDDDSVLQEETLNYGVTPIYKGATPVKEEDAQYVYTFDKWDKKISAVSGDTVYKATFKGAIKSYEIKFVNYDGIELYKYEFKYGVKPEYKGEVPKKQSDDTYNYTFIGWSPEIQTVTGEKVYTATFGRETKKMIVTFFNEDGSNVLESKFVEYNTVPTYTGKEPVKKSTVQYSYIFSGWDRPLEAVTAKTDYYARFTPVLNKYTVEFKNYDGTVLQSEFLEYGSEVVYSGTTPVRNDDDFVYTFIGWDSEVSAVKGTATYTARFSRVAASYTVMFLDSDGSILQKKSYSYDEKPVFEGTTPVKAYDNGYHYTFKGWDKEISKVTENTNYIAVYTASEHTVGEPELKTPVSCTSDGKYECSCECGYSYEIVEYATGHKYEYSIVDNKGYKTCRNCGDVIEVPLEEAQKEVEIQQNTENLCKYCGKYHYKYIFPDLGFISCIISRIFTFFAELFM